MGLVRISLTDLILCSPCSMPDDVILTCDIDNAGQESTTNDVHHIYKEKEKKK